jgi:hypothetical protein
MIAGTPMTFRKPPFLGQFNYDLTMKKCGFKQWNMEIGPWIVDDLPSKRVVETSEMLF